MRRAESEKNGGAEKKKGAGGFNPCPAGGRAGRAAAQPAQPPPLAGFIKQRKAESCAGGCRLFLARIGDNPICKYQSNTGKPAAVMVRLFVGDSGWPSSLNGLAVCRWLGGWLAPFKNGKKCAKRANIICGFYVGVLGCASRVYKRRKT